MQAFVFGDYRRLTSTRADVRHRLTVKNCHILSGVKADFYFINMRSYLANETYILNESAANSIAIFYYTCMSFYCNFIRLRAQGSM